MSRIGKSPVPIPATVKVSVSGDRVTVEGPKGNLGLSLPRFTNAKVDGTTICLGRTAETAEARSMHGLARALVNRPSLLLLDEPLGALDLKLRRQMQIELKAIQMEVGLTFLHVTHDQEEAMDMADTVAVMNKGHIEQMGAPEKLYDRPKTVFVSKFLGQSNLFIGKIVETSANSLSIDVAGYKISVPKDRAEKHTGKIAIGVRPEKADLFQVKPADSSSQNLIGPGEVKDIRFTGVSNQFLVDVPNIGLVTVFEQNEGNSTVELGDQVWISWKVEHSFGLADLPADTLDEE